MKYKSPTGTRDILPEEQPYWRFIEKKIYNITTLYHYLRVDPPIFEQTSLFLRGVGETTDIVEKEMYTFLDKGKKSLTLRPEFTAGIMRLYIENGFHTRPKPVKMYSIGPIFRYERPQAGRFRQHTQFNVEAVGEMDPLVDVEVMSIAWQLYTELGFSDVEFQLNSTGCAKCRPDYINRLRSYYEHHYEEICKECQRRLTQNPLRLLDCKNPVCQPVIQNAPVIGEHLCRECQDHFTTLKTYMDILGRPYKINHKLVRGLDYYTKTVFEVWAKGIGSQAAMCGGGRYDALIEQLGGPPTPGIGFGSGIERIILSMKEQGLQPAPLPSPQIYVVHRGTEARRLGLEVVFKLRQEKISAVIGFGDRSFKSQLRDANKQNAAIAILIGDEEVKKSNVTVKTLNTGAQESVPVAELVPYLKQDES